jgi:hypothetical protein
MKNRKLVTIDIEGQSNIGILDLGELRDIGHDKFATHLIISVENRLIEALQQHFDCVIRVISPANIKSFHPITVSYVVRISDEGGDYQETVTLNETWIY